MVELYRENIEGNKTFIRIKPDQFQEFVVHRRPDMAASFLTWEKRNVLEPDQVTKYLHRTIID